LFRITEQCFAYRDSWYQFLFALSSNEVTIRNRDKVFSRAREVALANLQRLDRFFTDHRDRLEWVRPRGGFTAFPRIADGRDARPFCEQAAQYGVLLAPGDCFGVPAHFRLGFGACRAGFDKALEILWDTLRSLTS
jgi:aspartate/methionine/tyrosine aminotransferase